MSSEMKVARFLAYATILTAGFSVFAVEDKEWWYYTLPFLSVVFLELLFNGWTAIKFLTGKWEESVVENAASKAVDVLDERNRSDAVMKSIASLEGEGIVDEWIVEAAKKKRLTIRVDD